jgi:putative transposase
MARKPRIEYEGAFYHVITRGNQRQKIFRDASDYEKYQQYLTIYKNRHHYALYAYVLMGNHIHLLLETRDVSLSRIMQGINQSYTLSKDRQSMTARRVFAQTAKLYGYSGKEIAAYLQKDPASVTGYLRGEDHSRDVVKVVRRLDKG